MQDKNDVRIADLQGEGEVETAPGQNDVVILSATVVVDMMTHEER